MTSSSESVAAAFSSMETAINAPPTALSVSDAIFVLWKSAVAFVVLAPDLDVGVPFCWRPLMLLLQMQPAWWRLPSCVMHSGLHLSCLEEAVKAELRT